MWSGRLPPINYKDITDQELVVRDAIIKMQFMTAFGMLPKDVDETPDILFSVWQKVAAEENRKRQLETPKK